MNRAKATAVLCISLLVGVYGLWAKSVSLIPLGHFWWDFLVFDGISEAMDQGLMPGRDFWSPMLLPIYLFRLATLMDQDGSVYLLLHLLQWAVLFVIAISVLPQRTTAVEFVVVLAMITIFSVAPFNHSTWGGETYGHISFNTFYNRFGDLLLILTFLLFIPPGESPASGRDSLAIGAVLSIAFMTKMSLFLILLGLVLVFFAGSWRRYRLTSYSVILATVSATILLTDQWLAPRYIENVNAVGKIRWESLFALTEKRLPYFLWFHWPELLALVFGSCVIVVLERPVVGHKVVCFNWRSDVFAVLVAATVAYTFTNFGDLGLLPLSAAFFVYVKMRAHDESTGILQNHELTKRTVHSSRKRCSRLWTGSAVYLIGICLGLISFSCLSYNLYRIGRSYAAGDYVALGVENDYLSRRFTVHRRHAEAMPRRQDIKQSRRQFNLYPADFVFWLKESAQAADSLQALDIGSHQTVYALSFPAFMFSSLIGSRAPKGAYPWLLVGHNVTADPPPFLPKALLSGVDIVMEDRCNLHTPTRRVLRTIFRETLELEFRKKVLTSCWDAYFRRG